MFTETGVRTYRSGPVSSFLANAKELEGGFRFMFDLCGLSAFYMPDALSLKKYPDPETQLIFRHAFKVDMDSFPYMAQRPRMMADFHNLMAGQRYGRTEWYDFFPVQKALIDGFDPSKGEGVLMVDLGGAHGYELQMFHKKFPDAKGRLILQDLPHVIGSIDESSWDKGVEKTTHDFFTPQPIKGESIHLPRDLVYPSPNIARNPNIKFPNP